MNNESLHENKAIKNIIIIVVVLLFGAMAYFALTQKNSRLANNIAPVAENENAGKDNDMADANKQLIEQAKNAQTAAVRPIDATDHYKGDLNAPVQLVIYNDFECPFCATFAATVEKVIAEFGDKVVVAVRHYTLRSHANAIPAAVASECASDQGKFWEMHDKLFENNRAGTLGDAAYKENALEIGLDLEVFNNCLDTMQHQDKIAAQMLEGKNAGVSGTPGGFVNGEAIPGSYPFEDFVGSDNRPKEGMKSIIERHLEADGSVLDGMQ